MVFSRGISAGIKMKRPKNVLGEVIQMASINAQDLLKEQHPSKKEIDAFAEILSKNGLIYPVVVREKNREPGDPMYGQYTLLAGRKRFLAAMKLEWPKIKAVTIPAVKKDLEKRVTEMVELCQQNKISDYDLGELGNMIDQTLLMAIFRLSRGYAYNLIRWYKRSIPEVKKSWKNGDPLINQHELEKMIQMTPEEAREYWIKRQATDGFSEEGFQPNKVQKPKKAKDGPPPRATPDQLWKLIKLLMESPLSQPIKNLCLGIARFSLGWQREVPGILTSEAEKSDYEKHDPILIEKQKI
jgi:hypothetical protein